MTTAPSQEKHVSHSREEYVARWNLTKTHMLGKTGKTLQEWLNEQRTTETPSDEWLNLFYWMSQYRINHPSQFDDQTPTSTYGWIFHNMDYTNMFPVVDKSSIENVLHSPDPTPFLPESMMSLLIAAADNPNVDMYRPANGRIVMYNRQFKRFDFITNIKDKFVHTIEPTWELVLTDLFYAWKSYRANEFLCKMLQQILDNNTEWHGNAYDDAVAFQITTMPIFADHVVLLKQTLPNGMRVTQERYFMGLSASLYSAEAFKRTRPMKYELSNEHHRSVDCEEDTAENPLNIIQLAHTAWMFLHEQASVIAHQFCSDPQRQCYVVHVECPNNPNRPEHGIAFLFMRADFVNLEQLNEKGVVIDDPL